MVQFFKYIIIALMLTLTTISFAGCGGEADYSLTDISPEFEGKFVDSAVEGLSYERASGESAITTPGGDFKYKQGETISFNIGNLDLGTSKAGSIITPRNLVEGEVDWDSASVLNRVRLLLALDSDTRSIGIQINEETREQAETWKESIDFSSSTFENDIFAATNNDIATIPTLIEARDHFGKTLRCAYSGGYSGAYDIPDSNETQGFVGAIIQSTGDVVVMGGGQEIALENGDVQAQSVVYSLGEYNLSNTSIVFTNQTFFFNKTIQQLQLANLNVDGKGSSESYDKINGSFNNDGQIGTFSLSRIGNTINTAYRYTGFGFSPDDGNASTNETVGLFVMDISTDGNVTGMVHDARNDTQPIMQGNINLSNGIVDIVVMTNPPSQLFGRIDFNDENGVLRLNWGDASGSTGYIKGDGCQLQATH